MGSRHKLVPPDGDTHPGREPETPYVVFISHSYKDIWIATIIAEKVSALGAYPWIDEKALEGGDVIVEEIRRGIDACREAIVLVSQYSVASQWVPFEIGAAWSQHKRVTPVLINVEPEAIAPIKGIKAIPINHLESFFSQLKARIEQARSEQRL
jgi:TIR domain